MDIKMLFAHIDLQGIETTIKEIIKLVSDENNKISLLNGEDSTQILLDIQEKNIFAYRVTFCVVKNEQTQKFYPAVSRTINKSSLEDLKKLIENPETLKVENIIKRILPLIYIANKTIKLKENEKKVQILLNLTTDNIIAKQVIIGVLKTIDNNSHAVITRVLGSWDILSFLPEITQKQIT